MNIGEYAYVRVSTKDQSEARQLIAMQKLGLRNENIYIEKRSGKDFDRPKYQQLLRRMRPGDILYIKSIDRLGRNYAEIQEQYYGNRDSPDGGMSSHESSDQEKHQSAHHYVV